VVFVSSGGVSLFVVGTLILLFSKLNIFFENIIGLFKELPKNFLLVGG
jgi:hypothetical protein